MKIVRYLDQSNAEHFGCQLSDGSTTRIDGCIFAEHHDTGEPADVNKLLAPLQPADVLCIGLNYRKHANEGGQPIPEYPIVFMKTCSAVQLPMVSGMDPVSWFSWR